MKKLLLSFIVLASLVSCGKDNKVSSNGSLPGLTNPLIVNNPSGQGLAALINSPLTGFGNGVVLNGSSNQNCGVKWGFLTYCYGSGSSVGTTGQTWNALIAAHPSITFQYSSGRTVRNIDVSVAQKQTDLINILNSATQIQQNGTIYYITTAAGMYAIDTRYSIQMNPSGVATQMSSEYFIQAF